MIDTVVVAIPMSRLRPDIICNNHREWEGWDVRTRRGFPIHLRNPTAAETSSGLYYPRLTGYRMGNKLRGVLSVANIEFSAPKLIYGNNVDELNDASFVVVLERLGHRLRQMGFMPDLQAIADGAVREVHYSKNLLLGNRYTVSDVIEHLRRIGVSRRLRHLNVVYGGTGNSMTLGAKTYSLTLYDKNEEVKADMGVEIAHRLQQHKILRFEAKMGSRKLRSVFTLLGHDDTPTFRDIFSTERSQAVLLHYWDELISRDVLPLFSQPISPMELLRSVFQGQPEIKAKEAIYRTGMMLLARDRGGLGELRSLLDSRVNKETWYRFQRHLRHVSTTIAALQPDEWYWLLDTQLREFEPLRLLTGEDAE